MSEPIERVKESCAEVDGLDCPNCDNSGWYIVWDGRGEPEQVQCEWCAVVLGSKFNLQNQPPTERTT